MFSSSERSVILTISITLFLLIGFGSSQLLPIPNGAHGAAVVLPTGETRFYYQADDTGLHEVRTTNPAGGNEYNDTTILPAFIARANSPLAAVQVNNFATIHLFYIGIQINDLQLRQLVWTTSTGAWTDGSLNNVEFGSAPGRQWLYAIGGPQQVNDNSVRVGFPCNGTFSACEATNLNGGTGAWGLRFFGE